MSSANPIQIVSQSPQHYVLSIQTLPIEKAIADQFMRFPQEQWPDVMSLTLSIGLEFLRRLDPNHIKKISRYQQLEELQRTMPLGKGAQGLGQKEEEILGHALGHPIESLFDDWQQRLIKSLENHITAKAREDPKTHHKEPEG